MNLVKFPELTTVEETKYNLIFYTTDYFIDSVLNVSFYFGILSVIVPKELFEIDTTVLDAALLGQMS